MKSILAILFLFICQFGMSQVPGTPFFFKTGPIVYTLTVTSPTSNSDKFDKANISGEIITRGQTIVQTGYIWGTSLPLTFATAMTNVSLGAVSGPVTGFIHSLAAGTTYYVAFYSSTASNTTIGNAIAYEHGVVTTTTGRTWMQWNLGATAFPSDNLATNITTMGGLYQWGRRTDGHQVRNSTVLPVSLAGITTNSKKYYPPKNYDTVTNRFFTVYTSWLNPQNDHLWQGVNGLNNPCPSGYRLPTLNEFNAEISAASIYGSDAAFNSVLKLQRLKRRDGATSTGTYYIDGGFYWTSSVQAFDENGIDPPAYYVFFNTNGETETNGFPRYHGLAVRCIKDYGIINSTHSVTTIALPADRASVSAYDCPSSGANGQMLVGVDVTNSNNLISQTITANVTQLGTYEINTVYKNIRFYGTGTFTGTGSQTITLNPFQTINGGAPKEADLGTNKYYLQSISPSCVFERTTFYPESYGTAKITSFNATTAVSYPGGVMTDGVPVSGVYQNVTATLPLATAGTYSLTTNTVRGVTFSGSGTFPAGGANRQATFQLIASGIPTGVIDSANNLYTLNPISNDIINLDGKRYTFGRHIYLTGTGTGIFSTLTTPASYTGTAMPVGTTIITGTGRTHRVTANVSTIGTYNISATNNGVTFHRAGSFTNTGTTNNGILLVPTGTPIASGTFSFTTNTNPSATFSVTF
jgi:uncharacterized protein (TIGR02145 family)